MRAARHAALRSVVQAKGRARSTPCAHFEGAPPGRLWPPRATPARACNATGGFAVGAPQALARAEGAVERESAAAARHEQQQRCRPGQMCRPGVGIDEDLDHPGHTEPVSYTHLTLPT